LAASSILVIVEQGCIGELPIGSMFVQLVADGWC
jgi:hypothetical protein